MTHRDRQKLIHPALSAVAIISTGLVLIRILLVPQVLLEFQPCPDSQQYADAARHMASGNGFVTSVPESFCTDAMSGGLRSPRYPPGFSFLLMPFAAFGAYPANVEVGAKFYTGTYVVAAVAAAWLIQGPGAAVVVALLVGISPFTRQMGAYVLSDALSAAIPAFAVGLLSRLGQWRISITGLLAGMLQLIRLDGVLTIVSLIVALPFSAKIRVAALVLPSIIVIGLHQWLAFGSPFTTGYKYYYPEITVFDWSYIFKTPMPHDGLLLLPDRLHGVLIWWACPCPSDGPQVVLPNILFYPLVLLGLFWIFTPPLCTLPGVLYLWQHRQERGCKFGFYTVVLYVGLYMVYWHQAERFMAIPATILAIYAAACMGRWTERVADLFIYNISLPGRPWRPGNALNAASDPPCQEP